MQQGQIDNFSLLPNIGGKFGAKYLNGLGVPHGMKSAGSASFESRPSASDTV